MRIETRWRLNPLPAYLSLPVYGMVGIHREHRALLIGVRRDRSIGIALLTNTCFIARHQANLRYIVPHPSISCGIFSSSPTSSTDQAPSCSRR